MLGHFRCWRTWCQQYPTSQESLASCTTSLPSRLEQQNGNNSSENSALETPSFREPGNPSSGEPFPPCGYIFQQRESVWRLLGFFFGVCVCVCFVFLMTGHILCEDLASDSIQVIDMLNGKAEFSSEILSHAYWGMTMKSPRKIFFVVVTASVCSRLGNCTAILMLACKVSVNRVSWQCCSTTGV